MSDAHLVERLRALPRLRDVPEDQLDWLAARSTVATYEAGAVVFQPGAAIDRLWVLLAGRVAIYVDRGAGPRRTFEWQRGDISGRLPYSRLRESPGRVVAEEPSEVLMAPAASFPEMVRECHELTEVCVHVMLDRARDFTSSDLQEEKMLSLGKLAAGLAHELNNPASAASRGADELTRSVKDLETAAVALGAAGLPPSGYDAIARLRRAHAGRAPARTTIAQSDWEDEVEAWVARHGLPRILVEPLADSAVTLEMLDGLARELTADQLRAAVAWFVAGHSARSLSTSIEIATARIYSLVAAVKGFTYMDQAATPKPVDVAKGLSDTLTVLRAKARAKSIGLHLDLEPGLPRISGFGGELNQVWANLVDNALDALDHGGEVRVSACRRHDCLDVRVADNGPGIPPEILPRIFDPFFTTKPPGSGTGLGLDIVRRLVRRQGGEVRVESAPGRTVFTVSLPVPRA
jgi:signal transduction histidine kinase